MVDQGSSAGSRCACGRLHGACHSAPRGGVRTAAAGALLPSAMALAIRHGNPLDSPGWKGSLRACSAPAAAARSQANPSSVPPAASISWRRLPCMPLPRARCRRPTWSARRSPPSTRSSRSWAAAAWRWSIGPGTASSSARWPSRCCRSRSRSTPSSSSDSSARPARRPSSSTPTSSPIYRVGRSGRVIYFVMKFLRGGSLSTVLQRAQEAHAARDPPRCCSRPAARWATPRSAASSIATSSPTTSCSTSSGSAC